MCHCPCRRTVKTSVQSAHSGHPRVIFMSLHSTWPLVGSSIACNLRQCRICRLLDHHCWFAGVAAGECERNYKFMVGSDSLGRCRRSCKACEACAAHDKACRDRNRHRAGYLVTAEDEE